MSAHETHKPPELRRLESADEPRSSTFVGKICLRAEDVAAPCTSDVKRAFEVTWAFLDRQAHEFVRNLSEAEVRDELLKLLRIQLDRNLPLIVRNASTADPRPMELPVGLPS